MRIVDFNINDYKRGNQNVAVNNGKNKVIIFRTDALGDYPVQGSIEYDDHSDVCKWTSGGICYNKNKNLQLKFIKKDFKSGDFISIITDEVLTSIYILDRIENGVTFYYINWNIGDPDLQFNGAVGLLGNESQFLAGEFAKNSLNEKIKQDCGKYWNEKEKTLFKNGDILVRRNNNGSANIIVFRGMDTEYKLNVATDIVLKNDGTLEILDSTITAGNLSEWHLANSIDIDLFLRALKKKGLIWDKLEKKPKPRKIQFNIYDRVLCKDTGGVWNNSFFGCYTGDESFPYRCLDINYEYCIPYNDKTKHLINTNEDCPEEYMGN